MHAFYIFFSVLRILFKCSADPNKTEVVSAHAANQASFSKKIETHGYLLFNGFAA
jgi:hypothetical protein